MQCSQCSARRQTNDESAKVVMFAPAAMVDCGSLTRMIAAGRSSDAAADTIRGITTVISAASAT